MADDAARARPGRAACSARGRVVVLLSGGRDSVCLLDVAVRAGGPAASRPARRLRAARGGRRRRGALRARCARSSGCALDVQRARGPRRAATCRRGRATCATRAAAELAAAARRACSRPATPPPTRPRRCSTGWPRRPGGARCSGMPPRRAGSCGRCSASRARRPPRTARARPGLARGRHQRLRRLRARARAPRAAAGAARPSTRARRRNVVRTAELLRDEAEVLDVVVDDGAGRARPTSRWRTSPTLPPALARLVVRRLAEDAAGGLCGRALGSPRGHPGARGRRGAGRRRRRAGGGRGGRAALRGDAAAPGVRVGRRRCVANCIIEGTVASAGAVACGRRRGRGGRSVDFLSLRLNDSTLEPVARASDRAGGAYGRSPSAATLPVLRKTWVRSASQAGGGHAGLRTPAGSSGRLAGGGLHDLRALQDVARLGVDDHAQLGAGVRQAQRHADALAPGRVGDIAERSRPPGGEPSSPKSAWR